MSPSVSPIARATRRGSSFWPAKIDFAGAGDGGDEGRFGSGAQVAHLVERAIESCGHVLSRHVAGSKDELADGMELQSEFFERVVADAFVARQQDPAFGPYQGEPCFIESSRLKVG